MGGGGEIESLGYLCYPVTSAAGFHLFLFLHLSRKKNCDHYYYYYYHYYNIIIITKKSA